MSRRPIKKQQTKTQTTQPKTPPQPVSRLSAKEFWTGALIITLLCFGLYANTIPFGYTFDDKVVITHNTQTQKGFAGIVEIFSQDAFTEYFGKTQNLVSGGRYRPLSPATFAVEWQLFAHADEQGEMQGNPHISHIINILLYALCSILIFSIFSKLLNRYTARKWYLSVAFFAAILFAAHPIHTEVVANIKGRDEILVLLGAILSLHFTLKYLDTQKIAYTIAAGFAFFVALLSKENTITFLAVIPLSVYFFTEHSLGKTMRAMLAPVAATILFLVIRTKVLGGWFSAPSPELMNNPFLYATEAQKYATIVLTWLTYLKLLFVPLQLTYDYYPYHIKLVNWADVKVIISLIVHIALVVVMLRQTKRKTLLSYSLWFYVATFSIVSNLLFPIGAFMNERFIFLSSIAFAVLSAYGLYLLVHQSKMATTLMPKVAVAVFAVVVALYALKTVDRNKVWENDYTLFTTDVQTSSGSAFGNQTAGKQFYFKAKKLTDSLEREKYFKLAIHHLTQAVTIHPTYANSLYFLGEAHLDYKKNYTKALEYWERLAKIDPSQTELMYRIGAMHGQYTQQYDKAIFYLDQVVARDPKHFAAVSNLGAIYYNTKQYDKAARMFERYIAMRPNEAIPYKHLAITYQLLNMPEKSAACMQKFNELAPK